MICVVALRPGVASLVDAPASVCSERKDVPDLLSSVLRPMLEVRGQDTVAYGSTMSVNANGELRVTL